MQFACNVFIYCSTSFFPSIQLPLLPVLQVACGSRHTAVLTAAGSVFAWGWNKYSQCGVASVNAQNVLQPTRVCISQQPDARALVIRTGRWHTCVVGEAQPVQPV